MWLSIDHIKSCKFSTPVVRRAVEMENLQKLQKQLAWLIQLKTKNTCSNTVRSKDWYPKGGLQHTHVGAVVHACLHIHIYTHIHTNTNRHMYSTYTHTSRCMNNTYTYIQTHTHIPKTFWGHDYFLLLSPCFSAVSLMTWNSFIVGWSVHTIQSVNYKEANLKENLLRRNCERPLR